MSRRFSFDLPFRADRVDKTNAIVREVSIITAGVTARGHELDVDQTTLKQMLECCSAKGQVPVKANHKSGVQDVTGYLTNFSIRDNKLKADWHILQSYPGREQILETAERMPTGIGLSVAFLGPDKPVVEGGRTKARCEEVLSVDYVTMPAANPDGLFAAKIDSSPNEEIPMNELEQLKAQVAELTERLGKAEAQNQELLSAMNPPSLEDLAQMDDQQLAELGVTREEVEAALSEAVQDLENEGGEDEAEAEAEAAGDEDGEAVGFGADSEGGATGLNARLDKVVRYFEAKMEADIAATEAAETGRVETALSALEQEIVQLRTKNEALELAAKTSKPARAVVELTSASHEFTRLVELSMKEGKSHGAAVAAVMKANPAAYQEYLKNKGVSA